ncbi:MAG: phosphopantothenate/pantothenate synthetase family protein, partial [Methanoregulaceae archaeon]
VITIDLNPLSRTARAATLTIVDELTRALPNITRFSHSLRQEESLELISVHDNAVLLKEALGEMRRRLGDALD